MMPQCNDASRSSRPACGSGSSPKGQSLHAPVTETDRNRRISNNSVGIWPLAEGRGGESLRQAIIGILAAVCTFQAVGAARDPMVAPGVYACREAAERLLPRMVDARRTLRLSSVRAASS